MDATQLLDLADAIETRRTTAVAVSAASTDQEKQTAQAELERADARVTELQTQLWDTYPQPYVRCRDIGHVWDVKTEVVNEYGYLARELQCYRCTTTRQDQVNRYGELLGRHYAHPSEYIVKGGGGGRYGKPFWRGLTYMVVAKR